MSSMFEPQQGMKLPPSTATFSGRVAKIEGNWEQVSVTIDLDEPRIIESMQFYVDRYYARDWLPGTAVCVQIFPVGNK